MNKTNCVNQRGIYALMYTLFLLILSIYSLRVTTPKYRNQPHLKLQTIKWLILLWYWFHHTYFLIASSSSQKEPRSGKPAQGCPSKHRCSFSLSTQLKRKIHKGQHLFDDLPELACPCCLGAEDGAGSPATQNWQRWELPNTRGHVLVGVIYRETGGRWREHRSSYC